MSEGHDVRCLISWGKCTCKKTDWQNAADRESAISAKWAQAEARALAAEALLRECVPYVQRKIDQSPQWTNDVIAAYDLLARVREQLT